MTEPFEHVTYVSFRRVDLDASDVTATAKRDALSGDVDLNALRPTGASMKAAPVSVPDEDELAADDLVIEMESLVTSAAKSTSTPSTRVTRSSLPPPLPARASRPSMPPTVRASLPATARAPSLPALPPTMPELPDTLPMLEADPPATVPSAAMTMRSFPPPPPPPHMAFPPPRPPPQTVPLPPLVHMAPPHVPPAFVPAPPPVAFAYPTALHQFETPSTAPVAMATAPVSFGYEPPRRKGLRLSPAALVSLVLLLVGSAVAFGTVLVVRNRAHAMASAPAESPAAAPAAATPVPPSTAAEPAAVPTIAPAALPSVVVGVDALPKASSTDPDMTLLSTPPSAKGHRIFVDGRVLGTGGAPLKTKCGDHTVKVGSAGKPRLVHLPCGGELAVE